MSFGLKYSFGRHCKCFDWLEQFNIIAYNFCEELTVANLNKNILDLKIIRNDKDKKQLINNIFKVFIQ